MFRFKGIPAQKEFQPNTAFLCITGRLSCLPSFIHLFIHKLTQQTGVKYLPCVRQRVRLRVTASSIYSSDTERWATESHQFSKETGKQKKHTPLPLHDSARFLLLWIILADLILVALMYVFKLFLSFTKTFTQKVETFVPLYLRVYPDFPDAFPLVFFAEFSML